MNAIPYIRPELAGVEPLQALLPALGLLACGLSEDQIVVEDNDRAERAHRAVLTSTQLLLTSRQILAGQESPERLYRLFRASVAHAVAHRRYSRPALTTNTLKPLGVAVVSAIEDARVERLLMRHYPGVRRWFLEQLAPQPNSGDFSFESLMARMDRALLDPTYEDDNYWVNKAKRLFDEAMDAHGLEAYDEFRAVASILANDLGQMRVRFDPQHYVVPSRYRDDNSYLWNFPEQNQAPEEAMALPESLASRKTATSNSAGDAQQEECEEQSLAALHTLSGTTNSTSGAATGALWSRSCPDGRSAALAWRMRLLLSRSTCWRFAVCSASVMEAPSMTAMGRR
jgi:hypothetical protein